MNVDWGVVAKKLPRSIRETTNFREAQFRGDQVIVSHKTLAMELVRELVAQGYRVEIHHVGRRYTEAKLNYVVRVVEAEPQQDTLW